MSAATELKLYLPECSTVRVVECSPAAWMIQLALEEKDLPYQVKLLPPATGKDANPELLTKNPRGTFPVLLDGAIVVYEPFAIMEYLEHAHPDPPLLPGTNGLRALALTRLHEVRNLAEVSERVFSYLSRTRGKDLEPAVVYAMADALHDELFFWEYYYGVSHWAAGSELTFADLAVFVHVAVAVHLGLPLGDSYPHLQSLYQRMRNRPSVHHTWPATWKPYPYSFLQPAEPDV
jgi:glutathione S-transferase